ncbi:hypothetical protein F5879DRAFT_1230 [Lentinula edodes]|nr:hypothetical protein F5879DRAFT_1230 [Lentinula edodes]
MSILDIVKCLETMIVILGRQAFMWIMLILSRTEGVGLPYNKREDISLVTGTLLDIEIASVFIITVFGVGVFDTGSAFDTKHNLEFASS